MKLAYLIIAHNEFEVLHLLVSKLDDARNDLFIHFDKKLKSLPEIHAKKSHITILDKRFDVRWGHVSQIQTEMALLNEAMKHGQYDHYVLISGTHLPLVDNDIMHRYSQQHKDESVLKLWKEDEGDRVFKFGRYHFFVGECYSKYRVIRIIFNFLWRLLLRMQAILHIENDVIHKKLIKSDQWCILSETAASYLVDNQCSIISNYRYTLCPDEYFVGSALISAGYNFFDDQKLLYVEFEGYRPRTLSLSDYDSLVNTGYLFARKFTSLK